MTIELRILATTPRQLALQTRLGSPKSAASHLAVWSLATKLSLSDLDTLQEQCGAFDYAQLKPATRLRDFRLLVSDMDSTLITIECIDEIADFCGKKAAVSAITEATMRGEIASFEESLRRRVAILKGLPASTLQQVYEERLRLSPGAQELLESIKALGIKTLLVSGGFTFFTERLKKRLSLDDTRANELEIQDDKLTGQVLGQVIDGQAKAHALLETCARMGIQASQVIAAGDGSNDLPMMRLAGVSAAFHAKPIVRAQADIVIAAGGLDSITQLLG